MTDLRTGNTYIVDHWGRSGYGPYGSRRLLAERPDLSKNLAEAFVWIAMEIYWTNKLHDKLGSQGGRLADPPLPFDSDDEDSSGTSSDDVGSNIQMQDYEAYQGPLGQGDPSNLEPPDWEGSEEMDIDDDDDEEEEE